MPRRTFGRTQPPPPPAPPAVPSPRGPPRPRRGRPRPAACPTARSGRRGTAAAALAAGSADFAGPRQGVQRLRHARFRRSFARRTPSGFRSRHSNTHTAIATGTARISPARRYHRVRSARDSRRPVGRTAPGPAAGGSAGGGGAGDHLDRQLLREVGVRAVFRRGGDNSANGSSGTWFTAADRGRNVYVNRTSFAPAAAGGSSPSIDLEPRRRTRATRGGSAAGRGAGWSPRGRSVSP